MKFTSIIKTVAFASVFALAACTNTPTTSTPPAAAADYLTTWADITGCVVDQANMPLANVEVSLYVPSDIKGSHVTVLTNANGEYSFAKIASGDYQIRFKKTDYLSEFGTGAAATSNVTVPTTTTNPDNQYKTILVAKNTLYSLSGSITGVLKSKNLASDYDNTASIASEKNVTIDLGDAFYPRFYDAKTDATGKFTFTKLPVGKAFTTSMTVNLGQGSSTIVKANDTSSTPGFTDNTANALNLGTAALGSFDLTGSSATLPVDLGTVYATTQIAPTIVDMSPKTSTDNKISAVTSANAPQGITYTFSKAVDGTKSTISLSEDATTFVYSELLDNLTVAWTPAPANATSVTLTPKVPFHKGSTVSLTKNIWGADGFNYGNISTSSTLASQKLYIKDGISLSTATITGAYGKLAGLATDNIDVAVAAPLDLNFNLDISTIDESATFLKRGALIVPATITKTGKKLTITPAAALYNNVVYSIGYKVTSAVTGDAPATGTLNFTTVKAANLAAGTLTLDAGSLLFNKTRTTYNAGDAAYVSFAPVANADTYKFNYYIKKPGADFADWSVDTAFTGLVYNQTTGFYTANTGAIAWKSGETLVLRLVASHTGVAIPANGAANSYSANVEVTDTTSPTSVTVGGVATVTSTVTVAAFLAATAPNAAVTPTVPGYYTFAVTLGGERLKVTAVDTTAAAKLSLASITYNDINDPTTANVTLSLDASVPGSYTTGKTVVITVTDAAANQYKITGAASPTTITVTLP